MLQRHTQTNGGIKVKSLCILLGDFCSGITERIVRCKFFRITFDILVEAYFTIVDFIGSNLRNVSIILRTCLPYLMWYLGAYLYDQRGRFVIGGEVFIPLLVFIITYYVRQFANRIGKGERIPVPERRFTMQGEEDGEYTIETSRTEELILYVADLEDWLQRKGLLKK